MSKMMKHPDAVELEPRNSGSANDAVALARLGKKAVLKVSR